MWRLPFTKNVEHHLQAVGNRKRHVETAFHKMFNECHSLAVGHKKRCLDETAFHKMSNVTHFLLVIGKDVMRLPYTRCWMSLTRCWSQEEMWWDCLSQNVQCHSLAVGCRKRCDETAFPKMCNVTHFLLVIGKDVMRLPFTKCAMSLTSCCHRKDVMRLPFTKCAMSLTSCLS